VHQPSGEAAPAPRRPFQVTITTRTLLIASAFVLAFWALVSVRTSVLTLFLALFAALVLEPVVTLMQRRLSMGRGAAATTLVLALTVLGVVIAFLLVSPFANAVGNFVDALPSIVQDIRNSSLGAWLDKHSQAPEVTQANVKKIAQEVGDALGGVLGVTLSGFSLILSLVTAIFLTLFLIIDMPRLIAIICGTLYGLSAWALGLPFPLALAFISGFLDLIPMVGATISGTILVLVALTQSLTAAVIMLAIVLIYQQLENYLLQPTILGRAADVSGFFVMASVIVFGTLLGAVGAIIAVPIVASIQIVVREVTAKRRAEMAALRAAAAEQPSG
jgi:predicted PurR-regulated permease PerM